MKVKVVSRGPHSILITDVETGEPVPRCAGFDISARVGEEPKCTLFTRPHEMEYVGDAAQIVVDPSLILRARTLAAALGNEAITRAFGELLGAKMLSGGEGTGA